MIDICFLDGSVHGAYVYKRKTMIDGVCVWSLEPF